MALFDAFEDDLDDVAARCESPDPGVRRIAIMELAESVEAGAAALLLKGLSDADPQVRLAAVRALDEHDGWAVVEGLARALEDPDLEVRKAAAEVLAEKKVPECAPLL